ncbi:MAG: SpoIIE family protein phosphatase [Acidobacteriaceae bacterium]|nr:SpoIIE family protein phosphatase [Acidobacteriaceae bacterium]MBV9501381.1 SpoIIE family protein phosphatase [Acidobacteriaceae bacterium]
MAVICRKWKQRRLRTCASEPDDIVSGVIILWVSGSPSPHRAHRCSFLPGRQDPYLRLGTVPVFVRDQERSLRFYLERLGFRLAFDILLPCGNRCLTVSPPDGTASLALIAPNPSSEEFKLIGRPTQIAFLTEDVYGKFEEWRNRGVRFHNSPQAQPSGEMFSTFEDEDGNSFMLLSINELTLELEEQRRAHAERLNSERRAAEELEAAREVQARLFPQTQPRLATLDYAGLCIPARHVGGDYYDFLDLGRRHLGLVTADISGKGTAAALLMANLQASLHNQCATYWSRPYTPFALEQPQRFLISVNRLFRENTTNSAYATLFFAEYDDATRRLRYANCGHPPALLLRRSSEVERLDSTSAVLGLFEQWDCAAAERELLPGDTLALYTDGVTESFNREDEEFGEHRLIEALQQHRELPCESLLRCLVDHVRQFSPNEQHDDITLVVARCTGD